MTALEALRHRRAEQRQAAAERHADGLLAASCDLRLRAQVQINAGHPELARPYLDEAELFDCALSRAHGS